MQQDTTAVKIALEESIAKLDINLATGLSAIARSECFTAEPLRSIQLERILSQAQLYSEIVEQIGRAMDFTMEVANQRAYLGAVRRAIDHVKQSHGKLASILTYALARLMQTMFAETERAIVEADVCTTN